MGLILFDADGTTVDFTIRTLQLVGSDRTVDHVISWQLEELLEEWHGPEAKARAFKYWNSIEFWEGQEPLPGAQAFVEAVRKSGHRLKFITAPWDDCPGWIDCRKRVIKKHFDVGARDVIPSTEKDFFDGDLLLEDRPINIERWTAARRARGTSGIALVADMPYNRPNSTPPFDWDYRVSVATDLELFSAHLDRIK